MLVCKRCRVRNPWLVCIQYGRNELGLSTKSRENTNVHIARETWFAPVLHRYTSDEAELPAQALAKALESVSLGDQVDHFRGSLLSSLWNSTRPEVWRCGVFRIAALNARSNALIDSGVFALRMSSRRSCSSRAPTTCQFLTQSRSLSVAEEFMLALV